MTPNASSLDTKDITFHHIALELQQDQSLPTSIMADLGHLDIDVSKHLSLSGHVIINNGERSITAQTVQLGLKDRGISLLSPNISHPPFPIHVDELTLSPHEDGIVCQSMDLAITPPWLTENITQFSASKINVPLRALSMLNEKSLRSRQMNQTSTPVDAQKVETPGSNLHWRFESQRTTFYQSKVFLRANFETLKISHGVVMILSKSARLKNKPLRLSMQNIQVTSGESSWTGENGFLNLENGELILDRVSIMDLIP